MRPEIDSKIHPVKSAIAAPEGQFNRVKTKNGKRQSPTLKKYFYKFFLAVIAFLFILVSPAEAGINPVKSDGVGVSFTEQFNKVKDFAQDKSVVVVENAQGLFLSVSKFSSLVKEGVGEVGAAIKNFAIEGIYNNIKNSILSVIPDTLSVIPAQAGIQAEKGLYAVGNGMAKSTEIAIASFVGVGSQIAQVPQFAADAIIFSGDNFAKVPQLLSTGLQKTGDVLAIAPSAVYDALENPKAIGVKMVRDINQLGSAVASVPSAIFENGKKLVSSAGNSVKNSFSQLSFTGSKSKAAPSPQTADVSSAVAKHGNSTANSAVLALATPSLSLGDAPLFVKEGLGEILNYVKTTAEDSAASLNEIFVEAPKTVLTDSWQWLSGLGNGINSFIQNTQLALLGRKVNVGEPASPAPAPTQPATPSPVIARSEATKQSQPTTIIREIVRQTTTPSAATSPFEKGGLRGILGSTTIDGSLTVTGNTILKGAAVNISAPVFLENNFTIASVFSLDSATGNLSTAGDITAGGKLSAKDLVVKGTVDFTGAKVIGIAVSGGTATNNYYYSSSSGGGGVGGQFDSLSINGDGTIKGGLTVTGGATLSSLATSGTAAFNGSVTIGDASTDTLTINASTINVPNGISFSGGTVSFGSGSSATSTFAGNIAVNGTGTSTLLYGLTVATSGGNVGIGTSNPAYLLDVNGTMRIAGVLFPDKGISTSTLDGMTIGASTRGTGAFTSLLSTGVFTPTGGISTSTLDSVIIGGSTPAAGYFSRSSSTLSSVYQGLFVGTTATTSIYGQTTSTFPYGLTLSTSGGNIGVGTSSPAYKLDVNGDINFYGNMYQNGIAAVFSNWTTTGSDIYRLSRVAIGTTAPTSTLTVAGATPWLTIGNGAASSTFGGYSTTATTTNPYGAIFANLGGNVGIGTSTPMAGLAVEQNAYFARQVGIGKITPNAAAKLQVTGGDIYLDGGGYNFVSSTTGNADLAFYKGGTGFGILRRYDNDYTILQIWAPQTSFGSREATLALVRGDEPNQEYLDLYNNGYASETQFGIRLQKRGTGNYRDFVIDFGDGTLNGQGNFVYTEMLRITATGTVGIGTSGASDMLTVASSTSNPQFAIGNGSTTSTLSRNRLYFGSSSTIYSSGTSTFTSALTDDATANTVFAFNSNSAKSNAKLWSLQENTSEQAYFDASGGLYAASTTLAGDIVANGYNIILNSAGTANIINSRGDTSGYGSFVFRTGGLDRWTVGLRPNNEDWNVYDAVGEKSRLYIKSNTGEVGIGNASPTSTLTLGGSTALTTPWLTIGNGAASSTFGGYSTTATTTNPYGAVFANLGGNVGIGTASPTALLDVNGSLRSAGLFTPAGGISTSTIDNTTIGLSTRAAGYFTALSSTGVFTPTGGISTSTLDNVIIGGSSPAAGYFTRASSTLSSIFNTLYVGGTSTSTLTGSALSIGTTAATSTLTVYNSSGPWLTIGNGAASTTIGGYSTTATTTNPYGAVFANLGGDVGIGTASPTTKLEVMQSTVTGGALALLSAQSPSTGLGSEYPHLVFVNTDTTNNNYTRLGFSDTAGGGNLLAGIAMKAIDHTNNYGDLLFYTRAADGLSERLYITSAGSVGIGITAPTSTLTVYNSSGPWLTIGNGAASTTIGGYSTTATSTFPYGTLFGTATGGTGVSIMPNGRVGIGTLNPTVGLEVVSLATNGQPVKFIQANNQTNNVRSAGSFVADTSGDMADGYGVSIRYIIKDTGNEQTIADIGAVRAGADNTGDIIFNPYSAGTSNERMRITSAGSVGIGTTAPTSTLTLGGTAGATPWLTIGNGTASTTIGGYSTTATTTNPYGAIFANLGGNVGIGTSTPMAGLAVEQNAYFARNVGIGTPTPARLLTLNGESNAKLGFYINAVEKTILWVDATNNYYTDVGGSTRMTIKSSGEIGIGTVAPSSTLEVYKSTGAWLGVGNGIATTTIQGNSTSTFPYGATFATTGGNVGIGTASPSDALDVNGAIRVTKNVAFDATLGGRIYKGSSTGMSLQGVTGSSYDFSFFTPAGQILFANPTNSNNISLVPLVSDGNVGIGTLTPQAKLEVAGGASSTLLSVLDTIYIGRTSTVGTSTLRSAARGSSSSTFYSDMWLPYRDMLIGGSPLSGNLWVGNGAATTTIRGGAAGLATSTFEGDVSIANLYSGLLQFSDDGGMVDAMNIGVSASAATGTDEGYNFLVDGLPAVAIKGTSDAQGSIWDLRLELSNNQGTATTTIRGTSGTTSTFAGNVQVNGEFAVSGNCTENGGACVDIAESYTSVDSVEAGDVVVSFFSVIPAQAGIQTPYNSSLVQKSSIGYASNVVGIVSTKPGIVLGEFGVKLAGGGAGGSNNPNIALAGRVPVKVTDENGIIKKGDLLVTSAKKPGYAMAMGKNVPKGIISVLGMALEDWNPATETASTFVKGGQGGDFIKLNKIVVLIKTGYIYQQSASSDFLTVSESGANIVAGENNFDFAGKSLINIKSLASAGGTWSLSEAGEFVAKSVKAQIITLNQLVIIGEKETDAAGNILDPAVGNSFIKNSELTKVVYNNRVKKNSHINITFRDNIGGPWWISNQGDGFFEVSVASTMGSNLRFSYWIVGIEGGDADPSKPVGYDENLPAAPAADTTPPSISAVATSSITDSSATITWTTDEAADSVVVFTPLVVKEGTGEILENNNVSFSVLTLSHSLNLTGLTPDTTYNYIVKSTDAAGNIATSQEYSLKTLPLVIPAQAGIQPDPTPPPSDTPPPSESDDTPTSSTPPDPS